MKPDIIHWLIPALLLLSIWAGCQQRNEDDASPQPSQEVTMPADNELYLHFHASGESFYTDIRLENGVLTYAWFEDTQGRCERWVKSSPCWRESDLQTTSLNLPEDELAELEHKVRDSGILQLAKDTFGKAKPRQRYYAQRLDIQLDSEERHLEYQSFPQAEEKPAAFVEIERLLMRYTEK